MMTGKQRIITALASAERNIKKAQSEAELSETFDMETIKMIDAAAEILDGVYNLARVRAEQEAAAQSEDDPTS